MKDNNLQIMFFTKSTKYLYFFGIEFQRWTVLLRFAEEHMANIFKMIRKHNIFLSSWFTSLSNEIAKINLDISENISG